MPNKILYSPKEGTTGFFRVTHCQCNCHKSGMMHIRPCCECGLIKTEIVNPKIIDIRHSTTPEGDFEWKDDMKLFDKKIDVAHIGHGQPEPEESQESIWDEAFEKYNQDKNFTSDGIEVYTPLEFLAWLKQSNFTIQRKKQ